MQESQKNTHREVAEIGAKKGLSATAIHRDLEETLGPEAVADSTVTMYLRTLSFRGKTEEEEIGDHDQPLDEVDDDDATLNAHADKPFSTARTGTAHVPIQNYGASASHVFPWLYRSPSSLGASPGHKAKRFALSRELLSMLDQEETRGWHNIITLDESWFDLCTDHELIWRNTLA
jgi:hypothetical protein